MGLRKWIRNKELILKMSRKITKRQNPPDPIYNSVVISDFINRIMKKGKKTIARKIVYGAFSIIKEKTKKEPLEIFELALQNAAPMLEVKPKRVGGATYQVPKEVDANRKVALAIRWIIQATKSKKGKPTEAKLAEELMLAANNEGNAVKKKLDTHRMAEANRAFAHFKW